jgi:hypothetical protein
VFKAQIMDKKSLKAEYLEEFAIEKFQQTPKAVV